MLLMLAAGIIVAAVIAWIILGNFFTPARNVAPIIAPTPTLTSSPPPTPNFTPEPAVSPDKKNTIEGNLIGDITGNPVSGADVYLYTSPKKDDKNGQHVVSDEHGKFVFIVNETGDYIIQAEIEKCPISSEIPVTAREAGKVVNVQISTREKVSLSGLVCDLETSASIPNLHISLSDKLGKKIEVVSNDKGVFSIKDVYLLKDFNISWNDANLIFWGDDSAPSSLVALSFNKNPIMPGILVPLTRIRKISGVVTDESSTPINKTLLDLTPQKLSSQKQKSENRITVNPNPDGSFSFDNLKADKFKLSISHPNHYKKYEQIIEFAPHESEKQVQIKFPKGNHISGEITDNSGKPVKSVLLKLLSREKGSGAIEILHKSDDGRFDFYDIPNRSFECLSAYSPDFIPEFSAPFVLPKNDFKIKLTPGREVKGVVLNKDGSPYKDAFIISVKKAFEWKSEDYDYCVIYEGVNKNERGEFSLSVFNEGIYGVEAFSKDKKYFAASDEIIIKGNEKPGKITLRLGERITVKCNLLNSDNQGKVFDAKVKLRMLSLKLGDYPCWDDVAEAVSGISGDFELKNITPGYHTLLIQSANFPLKILDFGDMAERSGEPITIYTSTAKTSQIAGQVMRSDKSPVKGVIAEALSADDDSFRLPLAVTDSDGKFDLVSLEPNMRYIINLRKFIAGEFKIVTTISVDPIRPAETKKIEATIE